MKTTPISIFNDSGTGGAAGAKPGKTDPSGTVYSLPWSANVYGLHVESTGTLSGTLTCWTSDKPEPDLTDDDDWVQDTGFSPTNPAGAPVKFRDDVNNSNARWKRLKYVHGSGTGKLFGYVTGQASS